jgi:seryl-tRNA synthetase
MNNSLSINQIQQNNGVNIQLNNEILKNKQLQEEIKKLNIIVQNQKKEITNLNSELQKYINENQNLKLKINKMNINIQNNPINNNEINNLRNEIINLKNKLKLKDNEINNLKIKNNVKPVYLKDIIVINFISTDYSINNKGIKCFADEIFAEVEERLYQIYDEFRNTNNIFLFKGNQILRFKKIKENKIEDGDQIQLVRYDNSINN